MSLIEDLAFLTLIFALIVLAFSISLRNIYKEQYLEG